MRLMKILFSLDDPSSGTERRYDGLVTPEHEFATYLGLELEPHAPLILATQASSC
jgi:hypothetical protein